MLLGTVERCSGPVGLGMERGKVEFRKTSCKTCKPFLFPLTHRRLPSRCLSNHPLHHPLHFLSPIHNTHRIYTLLHQPHPLRSRSRTHIPPPATPQTMYMRTRRIQTFQHSPYPTLPTPPPLIMHTPYTRPRLHLQPQTFPLLSLGRDKDTDIPEA
ncbi:hypothetical protein BDN67DRAFT_646198 [Paxillus ammoniavirescens]|nr:hypothetical protein BDN67DRAFT_646198 [Paxillus ammoniavirescens]